MKGLRNRSHQRSSPGVRKTKEKHMQRHSQLNWKVSFPVRLLRAADTHSVAHNIVDGRIIARGAGVSKKAAKKVAASQAIEVLGWVSILIIMVTPDARS